MTNTDDVTTIAMNLEIPDAEARALAACVEAFDAAHVYMQRAHDARSARGAELADLEAAEETLIDLRRGFERAREKRARDLGTLLHNRRLKAVR